MNELTNVKKNQTCTVTKITGDERFLSRIMSMGLVAGTQLSVVQNVKGLPLLIRAMDTEIALNKREAEKILVEVKTG